MPTDMEARRERYGVCGYQDTQGNDPCQQPAYFADGRCSFHTDTDERVADRNRVARMTIKVPDPTHERINRHKREGETLSGTIDRALDALEREQNAETWTLTIGTDFEWSDEDIAEIEEVLQDD